MKKIEPTKGPWEWTEERYKYGTTKKKKRFPLLLQRLDPMKDRFRDCADDNVFALSWPKRAGEVSWFGLGSADKKLIAAAPDLLELANALIDSKGWPPESKPQLDILLDMARKALLRVYG